MGSDPTDPAAFAAARDLLTRRGAATLPHPGGTLLAHLERVESRLAAWGGRSDLRLAGLCHAFYGTDGFAESLLPLERRGELAAAIGTEAEELVHFYASCDREFSYGRLAAEDGPFRDRFSDTTFLPTARRRADFAELTAANELDLAAANPEFRTAWGGPLLRLFTRWRPRLSERAFADARALLVLDAEERRSFLRELRLGEVRTGVVSRIEDFGVFVELGGVEGMVNATRLTRHHYIRFTDVVTVGEAIRVEVLDIDHERERISLSAKGPLRR
ncbi:DUF6817 domain-containing protein [Streptomyces sp. NPDC003943]